MTESILNATEDQLRKAQAKLTYLGPQTKPIPTVVFASTDYPIFMDMFIAAYHSHNPYANDGLANIASFNVKASEFRCLLLEAEPVISSLDASKLPTLVSFSVIIESSGSFNGQEFLLNDAVIPTFYERLINSLDEDNVIGREILHTQLEQMGY